MENQRLLLLCERDELGPWQQASSAAAAAVASGWQVDLEAFESGRVAAVSGVLADARAGGLGLFACSASVALLGREPAEVLDQVDEVVGWPTILGWMTRADRVLSL